MPLLQEKELYAWATSRCARKEYCRSELFTKLLAKGAQKEQIKEILDRLEKEGFINEARFARAYVSDKFRFDHWGRLKIKLSLRQKAIGEQIVEEALSTIDEASYLQTLEDFLKKKQAPNPVALARAAISRGFEPRLVFRILEKRNNKKVDDES